MPPPPSSLKPVQAPDGSFAIATEEGAVLITHSAGRLVIRLSCLPGVRVEVEEQLDQTTSTRTVVLTAVREK